MVTEIAGAGTEEARWRPWLRTRPWPDLTAPSSVVVVAPHPDDEVLGVGGLLATVGAGAVTVVAVTDGEASHPGSTGLTPDRLATLRQAETTEALSRLGLTAPPVIRLAQPDGGVDEQAVFEALARILMPGQVCLATWRGDGHPDHEAVGRAAAAACRVSGATLWEYPIWMWHWAGPDDPRVPWARARRHRLDAPAQGRKRLAIEAFGTQIAPIGPGAGDAAILPPSVLARFEREVEIVFSEIVSGEVGFGEVGFG